VEKKGERARARARSDGPRDAPKRFRSPDARASAGHADAFFYLKGVQLSATHGAAAAAAAAAAAGPPIRLVSSKKRAAMPRFLSSTNTPD